MLVPPPSLLEADVTALLIGIVILTHSEEMEVALLCHTAKDLVSVVLGVLAAVGLVPVAASGDSDKELADWSLAVRMTAVVLIPVILTH